MMVNQMNAMAKQDNPTEQQAKTLADFSKMMEEQGKTFALIFKSRATHFAVQNLFVEAILKTLSNLEVDGGSPRRSLPQHEFSTDQQFLHQIGNLVEQQNKLMVNQINAMAKQDNLTEDQTKNLEDLQNDE
ncbi:hypothetical protein niasHS_006364 [Heterodera schachtii]|uniref:Uncharacterized protein n=1 Tax=Heterodera schachtii TaxID=97005 RepID=A0ABD2JWQ2_HETSC